LARSNRACAYRPAIPETYVSSFAKSFSPLNSSQRTEDDPRILVEKIDARVAQFLRGKPPSDSISRKAPVE
jgi:hypothetical protein